MPFHTSFEVHFLRGFGICVNWNSVPCYPLINDCILVIETQSAICEPPTSESLDANNDCNWTPAREKSLSDS